MSALDGIQALAGAATTTSRTGGASLGQNDFLRLMTTQLTTQDPFNPMDNTQMVAQMAQFSQVAGIADMNRNLQTIADTLTGSGRLQDASNWIGRSMLAQSNTATPLRDGSYGGEITLPADAQSVTISLVDGAGRVVHTEDLGAQTAGGVPFAWDGLGPDGQPAAGGPLRMQVTARGADGPITATTASWTSIGGIQSPASGGAMRLVTGLGLLPPEAALRLA